MSRPPSFPRGHRLISRYRIIAAHCFLRPLDSWRHIFFVGDKYVYNYWLYLQTSVMTPEGIV